MTSNENHVAILLATYNGEYFIEEQILSIIHQTHSNWSIWVSDDGSVDNTIEIIEKIKIRYKHCEINILEGSSMGATLNFMYLLKNNDIKADYFAFSDQDDIWLPEKLSRALSKLRFFDPSTPSLYGARTIITDQFLNEISMSPFFKRKPSFGNALVQSIAGGNTMLLNQKARDVIKSIDFDDYLISHDWWVYIVVSGVGGNIVYDSEPSLLYRQHDNNVVGSNKGIPAKLKRLKVAYHDGVYRNWNETHCKILMKNIEILSNKNKIVLKNFYKLRNLMRFKSLYLLKSNNIYRQSYLDNIFLYIGAFIGKI